MSDVVARLRAVTGFVRFETGDRIAAAACLSEEAADKIEGLEADLEGAVAVAFKRGAEDWTRLNYPKLYATLKEGSQDE